MKITFVYMGGENLGVGYLSAFLKRAGHQVNLVFDPALFESQMSIDNKFLARIFNSQEKLIEAIKRNKPHLLAFSVITATYRWSLNLAMAIKEVMDIPIVFGGIHPTLVPENVLKSGCVDMVIRGEGEEAILELAESLEKGNLDYKIRNVWFKNKGTIIRNPVRPPIQNLDKLPFPDKELYYSEYPVFKNEYSIITARGCPFHCTFCVNSALKSVYSGAQKYYRKRSVDNVISELALQKGKKIIVAIEDDTFAIDREWLKEFSRRYSKEIRFPFCCSLHPAMVNKDVVKLLKNANCYLVYLGIQSASGETRKRILKRYESNEQIMQAARLIKKSGINLSIDHILGLPYEWEEEQIMAANFYNQLKPSRVNCYWLTYFPKIEIIKEAKEAGLISEDAVMCIENGFGKTDDDENDEEIPRDRKLLFGKFRTLFHLMPLIPPKLTHLIIKNRLYRFLPSSVIFGKVFIIVNAFRLRQKRLWIYIKYLAVYLRKNLVR